MEMMMMMMIIIIIIIIRHLHGCPETFHQTYIILLRPRFEPDAFQLQVQYVCLCIQIRIFVGRELSRYSDWLWAGRSGIEFRLERDFPPVQTSPGTHPASCKMGTGSFSRVKCGWAVLLTTHPLLVTRSRKNRAIPLPTLWATPGL